MSVESQKGVIPAPLRIKRALILHKVYAINTLLFLNGYTQCPSGSQLTMIQLSSAESQKGIIAVQRYSVENQKGIITIDFIQRQLPFGSQKKLLCSINALLALNWRYDVTQRASFHTEKLKLLRSSLN